MDTVLLFGIAVTLVVIALFLDRAIMVFERITRVLETLAENNQ